MSSHPSPVGARGMRAIARQAFLIEGLIAAHAADPGFSPLLDRAAEASELQRRGECSVLEFLDAAMDSADWLRDHASGPAELSVAYLTIATPENARAQELRGTASREALSRRDAAIRLGKAAARRI